MKQFRQTMLLLIMSFATTVIARPKIFVMNFSAQGVNYDVLCVMRNKISEFDPNNYMRTAYYINGRNVIVKQLMKVETGIYNNSDRHYAMITGYNVQFIKNGGNSSLNYNPDIFTFVYNDENSLVEPPLQGDVLHASKPVNSLTHIKYEDLTYEFLKQFFVDGEPELTYLLSLKNESNYSQGAYNSGQSSYVEPSSSGNTLTIQNNTEHEISTCYVYFDRKENCWVSKGWYNVPAFNNKVLPMGNYTGAMYIHGKHGIKSWGNGFRYCIGGDGAFSILMADQSNCELKGEFSQMEIHSGNNIHILNP